MSTVMVAGGGIGGLATAIALAPTDIEPVVYERASDLKHVEVGAGITLWPNAVKMLDRLGVGEAVRAGGAIFTGSLVQRTSRGRLLSDWRLSEMAERLGTPPMGIRRPDLHAVLASAAGRSVRSGSTVTGFEPSESAVEVTLSDGRVESGDALVGADGIESVIRAQLHGPGTVRYCGMTIWRAVTEVDDDLLPPGALVSFWGSGARFVAFRVGPGQMSWEGSVVSERGGTDAAGTTKAVVLERFAGFCQPVPTLIEATDDAAIVRDDVCDRRPLESWGRGRVTLLGDAAHPMTFAVGQGAAQALEDAVAIAAAIGDGAADVEGALRAYEGQRMERTARFQTLAWRLARLGAARGPAAMLRNVFLAGTSGIGRRTQEKGMRLPDELGSSS